RPARLVDAGQDRVCGVGVNLVRKVDAGDDAVEHSPREHRHRDMRSLLTPLGPRDSTGFDGDDLVAPIALVGAAARKPTKPAELRAAAISMQIGEPPVWIRLPGLDQGIGHGLAGAVVHDSADRDRPRRLTGYREGPSVPRQADGE